jgi:glycosyltransferase involved in cell wall biosynthesis
MAGRLHGAIQVDDAPLATIILPFRDAERTLAAAIRSLLNQADRRWRLLLIDDGSADGSRAIAEGFVSPSVELLSDGERQGLSRRLNQGVDRAETPFVARMDADDIAFPERLQVQLALIQSRADIDLVASPVLVFHSGGAVAGVVRGGAGHAEICAAPWRGFTFVHPTWLGRTAWFRANRYDPADDGAEDQALLYRAAPHSRLASTAEVLLGYREDRRSLGKQVYRRTKFWRAVMRESWRRQAYRDLLLVSAAQPIKMTGDVLNTVFGVAWARNRLGPASAVLAGQWAEIERSVR